MYKGAHWGTEGLTRAHKNSSGLAKIDWGSTFFREKNSSAKFLGLIKNCRWMLTETFFIGILMWYKTTGTTEFILAKMLGLTGDQIIFRAKMTPQILGSKLAHCRWISIGIQVCISSAKLLGLKKAHWGSLLSTLTVVLRAKISPGKMMGFTKNCLGACFGLQRKSAHFNKDEPRLVYKKKWVAHPSSFCLEP